MKVRNKFWLLTLFLMLLPPALHGGFSLTNLASFYCTNGSMPSGPLGLAADGNFYGTTADGGTGNGTSCGGGGTVFRMTPAGDLSTVVVFGPENGEHPSGRMVQGTNGVLYGTTALGGTSGGGTFFQISPRNTVITLFSFGSQSGRHPYAGLVVGGDGNLYGTTDQDAVGQNHGTIFQVSSGTNLVTLHQFNQTNGYGPNFLSVGDDGKIYGSTAGGGAYYDEARPLGFGTVFTVNTNGTFTSLASFGGTNGYYAGGQIAMGRNGKLYGTTTAGGIGFTETSEGHGTIYALTPAGDLTVLHYFTVGADGGQPWSGLLRGADDQFYGTTSTGGANGHGTIFRISADGLFTTIYSFTNYSSTYYLTFGVDGCLYGVSPDSGSSFAGGIVRFSIPMAPIIQTVEKNDPGIELTWNSVAGQAYQLQYSVSLDSTNWIDLGSAMIATNGSNRVSDPMTSNTQKFYRVALLP